MENQICGWVEWRINWHRVECIGILYRWSPASIGEQVAKKDRAPIPSKTHKHSDVSAQYIQLLVVITCSKKSPERVRAYIHRLFQNAAHRYICLLPRKQKSEMYKKMSNFITLKIVLFWIQSRKEHILLSNLNKHPLQLQVVLQEQLHEIIQDLGTLGKRRQSFCPFIWVALEQCLLCLPSRYISD